MIRKKAPSSPASKLPPYQNSGKLRSTLIGDIRGVKLHFTRLSLHLFPPVQQKMGQVGGFLGSGVKPTGTSATSSAYSLQFLFLGSFCFLLFCFPPCWLVFVNEGYTGVTWERLWVEKWINLLGNIFRHTQLIDQKCTATKRSLECTVLITDKDCFIFQAAFVQKILQQIEYRQRTNPCYCFSWQTQNDQTDHTCENI